MNTKKNVSEDEIAKRNYVLILPTYNEVANIEKCINWVFDNFPRDTKYDFHVLVVDGASPDGTANLVRKLISLKSKLHLIVEKEKSGLGSAYLKGMDYSFGELGADYVFQFDADLSHDATKLKDFVKKAEEGYDLVLGTRYRNGGSIPSNWKWHRKLLSYFGNLFIRLLFFTNVISDWTGGYKCVSKEVYEKIKDNLLFQKGYTFTICFNKNALDNNFKIAEVPFSFKDRMLGRSKLGIDYFFNALYFVVNTRIQDFFKNKFMRVCAVGFVGALLQLSVYSLLRNLQFSIPVSQNISIEVAILSNFLLNNFFSFSDRKIFGGFFVYLKKFVFFNFLSFGSILIQNIVMMAGILVFSKTRESEIILLITGILLGLIVNYLAYSKIIWKKRH